MWIESHQSLLTHRKTGRLARSLGISKITAIGHLHAFWWWCMDNAPDGDLADCTDIEIAEAAQYTHDPRHFVDALTEAGFIEYPGETPVVHDWFGGRHSRQDGPTSEIRKSKEYRQWRKAVKVRDLYICQDCGVSDEPVEAHHIKDFAHYPELRFDVDNGVSLCHSCHAERHGKGAL